MTFNSWGEKPGKPNHLFYMTSDDLVHWTPRKALGLNLTTASSPDKDILRRISRAPGGGSHRAFWHPTGRGGNDEKFHPSPQTG
jgi:hypothetical protein